RELPRLQYVADINLAWQFLQRGDVSRISPLLARHRPREGQKDLRAFAWRHLQPYTFVARHKIHFPLHHVEMTPSLSGGRHIALCTREAEPTTVCWELATNKLTPPIPPKLPAPMLAEPTFLSPDGRLVITGNAFQEMKLHDLSTGTAFTLKGHTGS